MSHISASVRLRPVRFAFLVKPSDQTRVLDILRINTCLWGGKFNPIIPFFRQVPSWWDKSGQSFETAKQIINGYLDRYEPDFLVEAEKGLADGLGFNANRVLQLSDVLQHAGDRNRKSNGLSTLDLYKELYLKEFQFERRHKHNITSVTAEAPVFEAFCASVFGAFPKQRNLEYLGRAFKDAFEPLEVKLNGKELEKLYRTGLTSALDIGHVKIEVDYQDHSDATIFVLNALEPRDLIDFWNLRTLQREITAVPIQWIDELSGFCRSTIKRAHRPMPGNPNGVMLRARVIFSRSIPHEDVATLYQKLLVPNAQPGVNCMQDWYPAIWRPTSEFVVRSTRPKLTAIEKTFDVQYTEDKPDIRFDSLHPEFAEQYGGTNRWANVIKLRDWSFKNQVTTVLPTEYKDPKFSPFRVGGEIFLPTSEGFVLFPKFKEIQHYWKLTDGMSAIASWFKTSGIEVKLSDSGRTTQQIIQTLGGFGGVRNIANAGVVKLLNEISRRPTAKSMQQREFINKVTDAVKGNIWLERAAEKLVKLNAVELGLELKCSKCSSWSWYSLKQLDYNVICSLCLRDFGFPIFDPSGGESLRWAYRLIGPFALPDYAKGGYAAALAIRFFSEVVGHNDSKVTWSSGQELTFPSGKQRVEADFILWYQRTEMFGLDHPTEIVFGEAKSFGREAFQENDIGRMKYLADNFPGAVLVFATMKESDELTTDEITRLRKLAEWGREYIKGSRHTRAPVILLTGTELFTAYSLSSVWKEIGGKHAQMSSQEYLRFDQLKTLADLTQQLYLGMPSYSEWLQSKWDARRKTRTK